MVNGIDEEDSGERITWKRLVIWRKAKKYQMLWYWPVDG
jgi:hypothetical protein